MSTNYQALAATYAQQAGIDPTIFVAQIQAESGFNPNAVSPAGAVGIAQFMPATAAGLGLNPHDPIASLKAAAVYDANNLKTYNGDYNKMLAAYNAGGGAVNGAVAAHGGSWLSFMPQETQNYVKNILANKAVPTGTSTNSSTGTATSSSTSTAGLGSAITGQLKQWGEYIAIFLLALLLIVIGLMLLAGKQLAGVAKKAAEA